MTKELGLLSVGWSSKSIQGAQHTPYTMNGYFGYDHFVKAKEALKPFKQD